jgi:hypothetical protein
MLVVKASRRSVLVAFSIRLVVALPSSSGNRATLMAIRRASSLVSTFACRASSSLSRD